MTAPTFLVRAGILADDVRAEAKHIDPAKLLLTLLFAIPFVCGWLAAQTVWATWTVISWLWAAVVVGWRTAYGTRAGRET